MNPDLGLDELRVVDFSLSLPGPFATQLLADMGAEVISVEPPGGDPSRDLEGVPEGEIIFESINRGKRSVELDLTTEDGRAAADRLTAEADAVVEGFRPGVAEDLGVGYEQVRERNPGVVYCSLTGFGQTGPNRNRPAHGLNVSGMAGFLHQNRPAADAPPTLPSFSVADQSLGLIAAVCLLAGLLGRERTDSEPPGANHSGRRGTYIDAAMFDAVLSLSANVSPLALQGDEPEPGGSPFAGRDPWYDRYPCADGRYVTVGALEPEFWRGICEELGRPELASIHGTDDDAVREAARVELEDAFGERPRDEWLDVLSDELPVAPVRSVTEAVESDQAEARGLASREGTAVGFPALFDGTRPEADGTVPRVGEHTGEVLSELGAEKLAECLDDG